MLKIWGRNTSSNVQKAMWAIGEMGLACERIDIGGPFGKNKEPAYLAMNPNGLIPTLEEEDGFLLWESNSIIRYLAAKNGARVLEPADLKARATRTPDVTGRQRETAPRTIELIETPSSHRHGERTSLRVPAGCPSR